MAEAHEIKHFDPAVLASVLTGIVMVQPFSLMHEAAEHTHPANIDTGGERG